MKRKGKFFKLFDQVAGDGASAGGAPATGNDGVQIDTLQVNANGGMTAGGSVAAKLLANGMQVNALRTNDTLRKDEWVQYDTAVVEVARSRMPLVARLMSKGLSYNLSNALGTTILQWEQVSEMTEAELTMSGLADSQKDRATFSLVGLPLPITHKDFSVNIRALEASRRTGEALDTMQARMATRVVSEKIEKTLVQGVSMPLGGHSIYGFTNHPSRNTGSLTSNWADSVNTTGEEIVNDVLRMMAALVADNMYGPYDLVIPNDYYVRLADDYKAGSDRTIMERVLAIPGIESIMPSAYLTGGASGKVVLYQTSTDVVDMVDGIQPTMVQWDSHGGLQMNFKVMAIMVPRLKADMTGQSGIAHFSV